MVELEMEQQGALGWVWKEVLGEIVSPLSEDEFVLFYFLFTTNY